jgi:hypothetical protein
MAEKKMPKVGDMVFSGFESDWNHECREANEDEMFEAAEVNIVDEESGYSEVLREEENCWYQAYWSELCGAFVYSLDVTDKKGPSHDD